MDQLQASFRMVAYLIDRVRQAYLIVFKVVSDLVPVYSNMIILLKVFLFIVHLENCNL